MQEVSLAIGEAVKNAVLSLADGLKADAAPGFVVIALLLLLLITTLWLWLWTARFCHTVRSAREAVKGDGSDNVSGEDISSLAATFYEWRTGKGRYTRKLGTAWHEFEETLVRLPMEDGCTPIRNAVRPSAFFNLADLGISTTGWRALPGVFVTLGLLLTFLGLIAALNTIGGDLSETALSELLTVASAKFIMSLTGLFCSILFGFFLRWRLGAMDASLHDLCDTIEHRLSFISLEEIATRQLAEVTKQSVQTQTLITELIANIDEPLKTGLPNAIRAGIADAMTPVIEQIGSANSEGMAATVGALSSNITDSIGEALREVSERLANAGTTLESLAGRMDQSSARMGGEMENAIARLAGSIDEMRENAGAAAAQSSAQMTESADKLFAGMSDALGQIEKNTRENSAAMEQAAKAMTDAASGFKDQIEAAAAEGREAAQGTMTAAAQEAAGKVGIASAAMATSLESSISAVTDRAQQLSARVSEDLLQPLERMRDAIERATDSARRGAQDMARFSEGAEAGAASTREAAGLMGESVQALTQAATPIRETAGRFEAAAATVARATEASASTMQTGAESLVKSAQTALDGGREALAAEREAIGSSLAAIQTAMVRFEEIAGRFDTIDAKIGDAFAQYRQEIEAALANIGERSKTIYDNHARALDTLTTVVSQAEAFVPQQKGQ